MFFRLNTQTLILIPMAVTINIALGQLVSSLQIPVFLDTIGTMLVAILGGPVLGMLTGALTNIVWGILGSPTAPAFAPVSMMIGLTAGLLARFGGFSKPVYSVLSGIIISLTLATVAVPVRVYLFGGVTGSGIDFLTGYLVTVGQDLFGAVLISVVTSNIVDKVITALVVGLLIQRLPRRLTCHFPGFRLNDQHS